MLVDAPIEEMVFIKSFETMRSLLTFWTRCIINPFAEDNTLIFFQDFPRYWWWSLDHEQMISTMSRWLIVITSILQLICWYNFKKRQGFRIVLKYLEKNVFGTHYMVMSNTCSYMSPVLTGVNVFFFDNFSNLYFLNA